LGCNAKSEDVGLIVRAISFQDFQPMWTYPPTSQTDGQTDRQTTCDSKTVLCTIVHRAVMTNRSIIQFISVAAMSTVRAYDTLTNRFTDAFPRIEMGISEQ